VHVAKSPSQAEIRAAIKRAEQRQARLSIVADVLRGPLRDRYDYFLDYGFPTWKGTEYYYTRYRPGLGTALTGVFLMFGGAAHYLALYMSWKRQREFVERYIRFARVTAWGDNLGINIPGIDGQPVASQAAAPQPQQTVYQDEEGRPVPMNRKMRRMQERESRKEANKEERGSGRRAKRAQKASPAASGTATPQVRGQGAGPVGPKKRVVAENGKVLVVDSMGNVYLEEEDEDGNIAEYLLDVSPPLPQL